MRAGTVILAAALSVCSSGCDGLGTDPEETCPSIPCPYGLDVVVIGTLPVEYSVEARAIETSADPWIQYCNADHACEGVVGFPFFVPPSVTLTFRSSDTTVIKTFQPDYQRTERTDECGGDCWSASLDLHIGGVGD